jgi:aminoglycoside 6'-N-acetyltransferase
MTIAGQKVVLRPVEEGDVDALVDIFAEPAVVPWWPGFDRARIEDDLLHEDDPDTSVYVIEVEGVVAGIIECYEEPEPEYKAAGIDIAVGTRWHGTGVALDALHALAKDLIERRGHHHLTIDPATGNGRAIACYTKLGFKPVGRLRQNERGGDDTFHDALLMDMLAGELSPPATP